MSPRKPLRTCRGGGGWEEGWGRLRRPRPLPVCAFPLQPGRRKRPHSTPPHSRPYECDDLLPKYLPLKGRKRPLPTSTPLPLTRFCLRMTFLIESVRYCLLIEVKRPQNGSCFANH